MLVETVTANGPIYGCGSFIEQYSGDWIPLVLKFNHDSAHYQPANHSDLIVGGEYLVPMGNHFKGQIGELRIWNRILTKDEIAYYKTNNVKGDEPGLAGCWTFEQNDGQKAFDISINCNDARLGSTFTKDKNDPTWISIEKEGEDIASPLHPGQKTDAKVEMIKQNPQFTATLPSGVTVELCAVSNYPENSKAWRPDGLDLQNPPLFIKPTQNDRKDNVGFAIKVKGPQDLSISYGPVEGSSGHSGSTNVINSKGETLEGYNSLTALIPNQQTSTSITLGISTSPWETLATHTGKGGTTTGGKMIISSQVFEAKNSVAITVSAKGDKTRAERVVAIDNEGQTHTPQGQSSLGSNDLNQVTVTFDGMQLKDIKEFQFQTRIYEWVTFKNVSLRPGQKTDVKIETTPASGHSERSEESDKLTPPQASKGKLEFRIVSSMTPKQAQEASWPQSDVPGYKWFPVKRDENTDQQWPWYINMPYRDIEKTIYLLVSDQSDEILTADGGWGLQRAYITPDAMSRSSVGFDFDQKGTELFYQLTNNHLEKRLAILIDGTVYSAPEIFSAVRGRATISGHFDETEVAKLVDLLNAGMPPVVPLAENQQPGFNPIIEITINDAVSVKNDSMIDFDTGKLFSMPEDFAQKATITWISEKGIDAVGASRETVKGLDCVDMIFIQVNNSFWESIKASDIAGMTLWESGKPGRPAAMTAQGSLPATYLFGTRERGMGILQILGFIQNPNGIKIRYKMLHNFKNVSLKSGQKTDVKDEIIAIVLGKEIFSGDIEPGAEAAEKNKREMKEEQFNQWLKQQRESKLTGLIFRPLLEEYANKNGLSATAAEIEEFARAMNQKMADQKIKWQQAKTDLTKELENPNINEARKNEVESQMKMYDQLLERKETERPNNAYEEVAQAVIRVWKTNKSLFETYGGRVIFQQGGPEPLDAYREFLKQQEAAGQFEIKDKQAADLFWNYFINDKMHTFYSDANEAKNIILNRWWLGETTEKKTEKQ